MIPHFIARYGLELKLPLLDAGHVELDVIKYRLRCCATHSIKIRKCCERASAACNSEADLKKAVALRAGGNRVGTMDIGIKCCAFVQHIIFVVKASAVIAFGETFG